MPTTYHNIWPNFKPAALTPRHQLGPLNCLGLCLFAQYQQPFRLLMYVVFLAMLHVCLVTVADSHFSFIFTWSQFLSCYQNFSTRLFFGTPILQPPQFICLILTLRHSYYNFYYTLLTYIDTISYDNLDSDSHSHVVITPCERSNQFDAQSLCQPR